MNLDSNNDGDIDLAEHSNCITIMGKLIIDQNLKILNCANVKMQPCSEIVINAHRTLEMDNNIIYGCVQMWRGINVSPFGKLVFTDNEIRDAENAITANGSPVVLPPGINPNTIIQVTGNLFRKNHIGVFILGVANVVRNLAHMPFTGNTFDGNGTGNLLPSCTSNLPNWNANNGYAGVVVQHIDFTIGMPTDALITNVFVDLRNGVISENCALAVFSAEFTDLVGVWTTDHLIPSLANSTGIGVLSSTGQCEVRRSVFTNCGHGVYAKNCFFGATENHMPNVRRGIEAFSPFAFDLSDNDDIYYRNRGIVARNLQTSSFSSFLNFSVNRNTIYNFDQGSNRIGIEMNGGNVIDLLNARISENQILLNTDDFGMYVSGV